MILVDTSVWIDHLRVGDPDLVDLLADRVVLGHPHVIGELAVGSLRDRTLVISRLRALPRSAVATDDEVVALVERRALHGRGLGWVDAHLLAGTLLTPDARLWARDRRLRAAADELGIAAAHD